MTAAADDARDNAKRTRDHFRALRPTTKEVPVGGHTFQMKTANLDQETVFLSTVGGLKLADLIGPVSELIQAAQGRDEAEADDGVGFMERLRQIGPDLWNAARLVLGEQFVPAVQASALAMLDNRLNHQMLTNQDLGTDEDIIIGEHGEFLGSKLTQRVVREELTLRQAVQVIRLAWTMNGYGEIMGNVLSLGATPE